MNEIGKIYLKSGALITARNYLLNQSPSDMVAISEITEGIVDLTETGLAAGATGGEFPELPSHEHLELKQAIDALDKSIKMAAPSIEILKHAKGVFDLVPWPPKGAKLTLPDLQDLTGPLGDIVRWPPK
jgi:hypothetical protein